MERNNLGYYLGITGSRFSTLLERQYIVPTLESPPNETTHSWKDDEYTVQFRIGELCRVLEKDQWVFYILQNISDQKYEWARANDGGIIYLSYDEYEFLREQGSLSQSMIYMIMENGELIELRIGEILIGVKESASNGFPYYFPIVF